MGQNGSFKVTYSLTSVRSLHDLVVYTDKVFMIGGTTDSGALAAGGVARIEMARMFGDGTLSTFTTLGNIPAARLLSDSVASPDGDIYTVGGQNTGGTAQASVYWTTLSTDGNQVLNSVALSNFPKATMTGHKLVYGNGFLYCIGGGAATQTDVYYVRILNDGSLDGWAKTTSHPVDISFAGGVFENGYLYTVGGLKNTGTVVQTAVYRAQQKLDGTLGSWVKLNDMAIPRQRHACFVQNGRVYSIGGAQTNVATNAIASKEFAVINADGSLSNWQTTGPLTQNIRNCRSVVVNGQQCFTVGGFDGTNAVTSVHRGTFQHDGHI